MKLLKVLALGSFFLASSFQAQGFGIGIGPFDLEFNATPGPYVYEYQPVLDHPICTAISNQRKIEMRVESVERISDKEISIVVKTVVIEPYAFGISGEGKPVLRGKIVDEKEIKKVTVKYGEPQFSEENIPAEQKSKGHFSGWFKSSKSQTIDIRKMSDIRVLEDSHFDLPKKYKGFRDEKVRVICEIPTAE